MKNKIFYLFILILFIILSFNYSFAADNKTTIMSQERYIFKDTNSGKYIVDSQTGMLWKLFAMDDDFILVPVYYYYPNNDNRFYLSPNDFLHPKKGTISFRIIPKIPEHTEPAAPAPAPAPEPE